VLAFTLRERHQQKRVSHQYRYRHGQDKVAIRIDNSYNSSKPRHETLQLSFGRSRITGEGTVLPTLQQEVAPQVVWSTKARKELGQKFCGGYELQLSRSRGGGTVRRLSTTTVTTDTESSTTSRARTGKKEGRRYRIGE
jgi:hypothetical protein